MLKVEEITFNRGEDGNLLPQEVVLETLKDKPTVKARPLTRGKLMEIHNKAVTGTAADKAEADLDVIRCGLVEPVMDETQLEAMKPSYAGAISLEIMSISLGLSQDKVGIEAKKVIENQEAELKKK